MKIGVFVSDRINDAAKAKDFGYDYVETNCLAVAKMDQDTLDKFKNIGVPVFAGCVFMGQRVVGKDRDETALECLGKMVDDDTEIISVYYGKDVTEEEAENFKSKVLQRFDSCDVELQYGGQPIYFYLLSAE